MGLQDSAGAIARTLKEVEMAWLDAQRDWKDGVAERFESKYIQPLAGDGKQAISAMSALQTTMNKIRSDLRD